MSKHKGAKNPAAAEQMQAVSEEDLERIESDPGLQQLVEESDQAEKEGRWTSHDEVIDRLHAIRTRNR